MSRLTENAITLAERLEECERKAAALGAYKLADRVQGVRRDLEACSIRSIERGRPDRDEPHARTLGQLLEGRTEQ